MLAYRNVEKDFFKPNTAPGHLSEIYDASNDMPEYALIGPTGKQIGLWMKCKDYIQDAYWGQRHGRAYSIYGFNFNPETDKVSNRYLLLVVRWKGKNNDQMSEYLANAKKTIERLESKLGIPKYRRTRFSRVFDGMFVVWGSPDWLRAIATVSFFACLVRAAFYNKDGSLNIKDAPNKSDVYYLKSGKPFIDELKKNGLKAFNPDWDNDYGTKAGQAPATVGSTICFGVHGNGFVRWSQGKGGANQDDDANEDWGI